MSAGALRESLTGARLFAPLLRLVLGFLGALMVVGGRVSRRFRRQVTRDVTVQVSSDDGVSQTFLFHARTRTMTLSRTFVGRPDCALRFATAREGVSALLSPRAIGKVVEGMNTGGTRIDGNSAMILWFYGLTRVVFPIGRSRLPRRRIPHPTRGPEREAPWATRIIREPAVKDLAPEWSGAWRARSRIVIVRVPDGESPPPG
ncbi:MAG TPA: hypothetical protein VFE65_36480 [Pseudonocardia sp.]|jgi:hypothetical protein|nr:hypothetical protein [Pseudonocardia sp.]